MLSITATLFVNIPAAEAATSCSGSSCVGVDPATTTCEDDAITIRAIDVDGDGMLEMRWSQSCNAGWARFTTYRRGEIFGYFSSGGISHAYVSTWTDQGTQDSTGLIVTTVPFNGATWWSRMVDFGRPEVCIGVRLYAEQKGDTPYGASDTSDLGWTWGPCVT